PDSNPTAAPCVMVIFGVTGDLTKRKLLPALCNLAQDNLLPQQFAIVGFATNDYTTEGFRKMLGEEIPKYAPTPVDLKFWDGIVEKPFGHDLESAKQLNQDLMQVLTEKQIYRIDHYLGKETVQNVMVFRFSNNIIEPLWNRNYVDHVQITAAETVGVEHRGGF